MSARLTHPLDVLTKTRSANMTAQQIAALRRLVPKVGVGAAARITGLHIRRVCRWANKLDLARPGKPSPSETEARSAQLLWAEATGASARHTGE